jgi:hypothetical protein
MLALRRIASILLLYAAVSAVALFLPGTSSGSSSRLLATCTPDAKVPHVYSGSRTGYAYGYVWCGSPPPAYSYTIRMVNRAGSALITKTGSYGGGTQSWNTPTVPCAGAWVHTFLYINVVGAGKSDTSGDTYC